MQTVQEANFGLVLYQYYGQPKVTVGKAMRSYGAELRVYRQVNGVTSAGAEAVSVSLRCVATSVCSVPQTVTIAAGYNYADVPITGLEIGSTQIEASAAGFTPSAITMETVTPSLVFYDVPSQLQAGKTYGSVRVYANVPGAYYSGTNLTLAQEAAVTLTSSVPSVATVVSTGVWKAGASVSQNSTLKAVAPGVTSITASIPGFNPVTSTLTVNP